MKKLKLFGFPVSFDPSNDRLVLSEGVSYEDYSRKYSKAMFGLLADRDYLTGDDPYYDFYKAIVRDADREKFSGAGLRYDSTVIMAGHAGAEFKKTAGHFHCEVPGKQMSFPELYQVVKGRAIFVMQKVDDCRKEGRMVVEDAILAEAGPGETVVIPPDYGHCTVNISDETMVFINLVACASQNFYGSVKASAGMCCYVMQDASGYRIERNPRYDFTCEPRVVAPLGCDALGLRQGRSAYEAFLRSPEKFAYLREPEQAAGVYLTAFRAK